MVKLVESSQWEEDLYQIETADPVEGGPDGVSNKQAKQLGGRTRYLKAQVEQSQTGLAQHIAAADPHTQYATKTDLAAKLAALVGQSPQSLDTLKELADALGNDPNFATTIVNALAQKAAIDSPTFAGTPKGPTAPQFDNSTRLATTAFIQRQGLKASGFEVYTATATLPASVCGAVIYTGGPSAFTLTLPPASAVPGGARIEVYSMAGAGVTFSAQGSDTIPATGSKTIVLNAGDTMALQSNGIDHWELVGGSVALLYASVMAGASWRTPPQFDSSGKLATTAFVQQSAGNFQTRKYINGSATLAASDTGSWVEAGGTGPSTITLPSPATSNLTYTVTNVTSNGTAVAISTPTASIYNQASASASFSLDVGATVELVSDASNWTVIAHYTRSPSAQTAPQYDNSTRLATTAFVKQSGESFSGIQGINATASLNGGHVGAFIWAYGAGITLTLPPVAGVPNGATITIGTPVGMTVKGNGTENINNQSGGLSNTFALNAGEQAQFVSNTGAWYLSSYTTVLGSTPPQFDSSNKLATTAFVQREAGSYRSPRGYVGNVTLSAIDIGAMITWDGNGTLTLPDASAFPSGSAIRVFKYAGPIASVLAANKTGQLNVPTSGADTYTFAVGVYGFFELINESSVKWDVAGELFNQFGTTAPLGDSSKRLATTEFVQLTSAAVVGSMRNAAMGVPVPSTSATFTAEEIVVETALGGVAYKLANFNETINLATTGMDTGSAPVSGYVGLYAGFNPSTGARKLFARNATSTVLGSVYGGSNPPPGIVATALVSVWPTNGNGQFVVGLQIDREVAISNTVVLTTSTPQAALTSFSAAAALPPNARFCRGDYTISSSTASAGANGVVVGTSIEVGRAAIGATSPTPSGALTTSFPNIPIVTPQTLFYRAGVSAGTLSFSVNVVAYTF
ncbi:hypothetical protein [Burkholderia cepacia]|uniref:hypothetical protein n=1 Tax=Burkholderia cepacia TaxID=292 RepID=UPI000AA48ADA|nr:hypothetical protein [Burkholderia cepacia]